MRVEWSVMSVVCCRNMGMNALRGGPSVHRIVVEHRDRFCWFGLSTSKPLLARRAVSW